MIVGVNVHPAWAEQSDAAVRAKIRTEMKQMGATAVRLDYAWGTIEPQKGNWQWAQLDKFINEYAGDGLKVLLMLYWPPAWSSGSGSKNSVPGNPADFGNACGKAAQRYGDKLAAVEMWNEPDLTVFWSGTRSQFSDLAVKAYPVAKAMAPNTMFLAAAPTYLGLATNWFKDMYNNALYRPGTAYDAQAIHPYMSPSDLPPDAPKSNWSILGIEDLQTLRASKGDTSPLWVTEYGWSTHDSASNEVNHKRGVTEDQQADFYVDSLVLFHDFGIEFVFPYTDRDMAQTSDPHERNFGLMRVNNTNKPAVDALAEVLLSDTTPPDPAPEPEPDNELEERVAALEAINSQLAVHLRAAADALD